MLNTEHMRLDTNKDRLNRFMSELGDAVRSPARVYLTGGACAVLLGWREMTLDVDLKVDPEPAGFFEALPKLKESLNINIEMASPDLFIPPLPGWEARSRFIAQRGKVAFYHYDFYGQALAKIERDHVRDRVDVAQMLRTGEVDIQRLLDFFQQIEPLLIRYPALDPASFKARVLDVASKLRMSFDDPNEPS